jgi:hypothetical protein
MGKAFRLAVQVAVLDGEFGAPLSDADLRRLPSQTRSMARPPRRARRSAPLPVTMTTPAHPARREPDAVFSTMAAAKEAAERPSDVAIRSESIGKDPNLQG